jgi:hypothetical protein
LAAAYAAEINIDGKSVEVPVCGGFAGIICKSNEWCNYPPGATCGHGDHFGACRPRPQVCPHIYLPVCGCDSKTYSNECVAHVHGVDTYYHGPCREDKKELQAQ